MKSHLYVLNRRELAQIAGFPLIVVGVFCLLLHGAAWLGLLPAPRRALDADSVILTHQAEASRGAQSADTVLIGDSSCLMDVSALHLSDALSGNHSVLNLGTMSYLDLPAFSRLVKAYVAANPGKLRQLVLLMHPEALRRSEPSPYHVDLVTHHLEGTDFCNPEGARWICILGREKFQARLWSRLVANPLKGAFARKYGFTSGLWSFMDRENGSLTDPNEYDPTAVRGNAEYRLARSIQEGCRILRLAAPPGVRFFVGITPVPEGIAPPGYSTTRSEMLYNLTVWLGADPLDDLPATLPDQAFATTTHLNERSKPEFSERLARSIFGTF